MNKSAILFLISMSILTTESIQSQDFLLKVWPKGVPGSIVDPNYIMESELGTDGLTRVSKVTDPTLEVFLAPAEKSTGSAVIICPGGGYGNLSVTHEGYEIASWLNEHGVAGIVLKYRLPHETIMEDKSVGPLQDAQESIRIVRRNAGNWGLDPERIGIIGFSAGGHLASSASTHFEDNVYKVPDAVSARPDFSILVYPVISFDPAIYHAGSARNLIGENPPAGQVWKFSSEKQVGKDTPPAFLVHSLDDEAVPFENSVRYLEALRQFDIPAELHLYEGGGHGYGMGRGDGTETTWPESCIKWLESKGFAK